MDRGGDNEVRGGSAGRGKPIYTDRSEITVDQIRRLPAIVYTDSTVWMLWWLASEAHRPKKTGAQRPKTCS